MKTLNNQLSEFDKAQLKKYWNLLNTNSIKAPFSKWDTALCINNPTEGILLSGINPSGFNRNSGNTTLYSYRNSHGTYWRHKHDQIDGNDEFLLNHTAYIDLFPFVETKQEVFLEEIRDFTDFQVKTLEITLEIIENHIKPKLIIAANKATAYYWGLDKKSTWLGYNLIPVKEEDFPSCLEGKNIELFQIHSDTGYKNGVTDRIRQDKFHKSNINGSYFISYAMYDDRHIKNHPEKVLMPEIVKSLFLWIQEKQKTNNGK